MAYGGNKTAFVGAGDLGAQPKCALCSQLLTAAEISRSRGGVKLCSKCAKRQQKSTADASAREELENLYATIREVFGINDIPSFFYAQIEDLKEADMSYFEIAYTIRYAVNICGFPCEEKYGIKYMVEAFRGQARDQLLKDEKVREANRNFIATQGVRFYKPSPSSKRIEKPEVNLDDM